MLIPLTPKDAPMADTDNLSDFTMVLEIHNAGDRVFIRSILDAEGVDYFIQGETVAPYIFHSVPMRLMVRKDQVPMVHEILGNFEQAAAYDGLKRFKENP
jgi:hypothetical protein